MHELHKAVDIIEHAIEHAKENGFSKVTKINLVIGNDSGFSGESIKMHFEDASAGTICEGAEIAVRQVETMLRCPKCHEMFVRKPFQDECPHCKVPGEPTAVGKEMAIDSIEGTV